MKSAGIAALLWIVARPLGAELTVRANADGVGVEARAAPLSSVLDALARRTGMKIVYDGPAPAQLVTVSLSRPSLRDVVYEVLEAQGVGYGLAGDAKTVTILVVVASAASAQSRVDGGGRGAELRPADEDGEMGIPPALQPLLPPTPDAATQGIPLPLQNLIDERDRTSRPGTQAAPSAAIPPALLGLAQPR
jgi:hypothetical protein